MIKIITGKNDFLRTQALKSSMSEFSIQYGDLGVERINCPEVEYKDIYNSITSLPFLVERKLIVLYEPSKNTDFIDKLANIDALISGSIDVIIYEPNLDKRSSYYKEIKKLPNFMEYSDLSSNELASWVVNYSKKNSGSISYSDANLLIERVGPNQLLLKNELDKLMLNGQTVTRKIIEEMTEAIPRSSIFNLLDSAFRGDQKTVIKLYDQQKKLRVEAAQIMALIIWQIHILAIIKTSDTKNADMISKKSKISRYTIDNGIKLLSQISDKKFKSIINDSFELDLKLKTAPIDYDEAVLYFLISLGN